MINAETMFGNAGEDEMSGPEIILIDAFAFVVLSTICK